MKLYILLMALIASTVGFAGKANMTWYTSYPDPKSEECIKYNGCKWAGQFAALPDKMPESWVKANNIIAIHEKDFKKYKLKTFRLTQGSKSIDAKVYDMCSDSDCNGCCTKNSKSTGFLIDIESYTAKRLGASGGIIDWVCLDCDAPLPTPTAKPSVQPTVPPASVNFLDSHVFDVGFYRSFYHDLKPYDDAFLQQHWKDYGMKECRQAIATFSASFYLNKYADLKKAFGSDCKLGVKHYLEFGIKEGRSGQPPNVPTVLPTPSTGIYSPVTTSPAGNKVAITYKDQVFDSKLPQDLPDFSYVGYQGGGVAIPMVPVVQRIEPSGSDDTKAIQAAVDSVAKLPIQANGFRGTLLFAAGTFKVAGTINIKASGIVLGGSGPANTTIYSTSKDNSNVLINVNGNDNIKEVANSRTEIISNSDLVVAHNNPNITVKDAGKYKVGDAVIVYKNTNDAWIKALDTAKLGWTASRYRTSFERTITAINGNQITLNTNVPEDLRTKFGGAQLFKYTQSRLNNIGIENMSLASAYVKGKEESDENHASTGIEFNGTENGWVDNIIAYHFWLSGVHIMDTSRFITIQNSSVLDPVSQITGGRRYPFYVDGQNCLVFRSYARNGRHDFVTGSNIAGTNVFTYSKSELAHADSGSHMRYSIGTLYDNVNTPNLSAQDRLTMGTGHGQSSAYHVFWNDTVSNAMICQNTPISINWLIGGVYKRNVGAFKPRPQCDAYNPQQMVSPESLYLYQLNKRLGDEAIKNLFKYRF